jgi:integrase
MAGCRPLTNKEVSDFKASFKNQRDLTLFMLGHYTGWRISQRLVLKLKHVLNYNKVSNIIRIERKHVKGKTLAQETPVHPQLYTEITKLIEETYGPNFQDLDPELPLFKSREGDNQPISRKTAHHIMKEAVKLLKLEGKINTGSNRKTFGQKVYKTSGNDLLVTQRALNHSSILTTVRYLDVHKEVVDKIILDMV